VLNARLLTLIKLGFGFGFFQLSQIEISYFVHHFISKNLHLIALVPKL
jgi:hypothetical protein